MSGRPIFTGEELLVIARVDAIRNELNQAAAYELGARSAPAETCPYPDDGGEGWEIAAAWHEGRASVYGWPAVSA